ncbi:wax ester/triacylglycerol synthase domain-containing protein [Nocardia grenadensis]|uniref:wax ester/triacylglycerol synthase domain-containing protein n=1 Tax=Nocardia grenadensis TaxID=931537 RepID=UPI001FE06560|nr:wax ester/triacylglycerol synthase domain-containing protein [Nocardia grenadensis]
MGTRESHMTQSDLFTWSMEQDPALRSTIVSVLILDSEPEWDRLVRVFDRGTRVAPGFRHVLAAAPLGLTPPRWQYDPNFDLFWHLRRIALPPPADQAAVLEFARNEVMTAFDPVRPLWTFTLLSGRPGGGSAAVLKVHHSLTDGVGGMQIATEVLDFTREGTERGPVREREPRRAAPVADVLAWNWSAGWGLVRGGAAGVAAASIRAAVDPVGAVRDGVAMVSSLARLARPVTETMSPVMIGRGLGRQLTVLEVPLTQLEEPAVRAGCTVNDAFLTALLLGLRSYHRRYHVSLGQVRVTVPISTRTADDPPGGNRITLARFAVPADTDDVGELMWVVRDLVERWRREPAIPWSNAVAAVFNRLPAGAIAQMLRHVDFVASDVAGSPVPLYLAGAEVERMHAFGPTIGTAFNATLISHMGTCSVGINADTAAVPDLPEFTECLASGFRKVAAFAPHRDLRRDGMVARSGERSGTS